MPRSSASLVLHTGESAGADEHPGWTVTVTIRVPDPTTYMVDETFQRVVKVLKGHGPVLRLQREDLVVGFGVDAATPRAAQEEAAPLITSITNVLGLAAEAVVDIQLTNNQELGSEEDPLPSCIGVGEAAEILGVSKQRVHQLTRESGFPKPVFRLKATPVWRETDVRRLAQQRAKLRLVKLDRLASAAPQVRVKTSIR